MSSMILYIWIKRPLLWYGALVCIRGLNALFLELSARDVNVRERIGEQTHNVVYALPYRI